jgi:hypothetical protein
VGAGAQDGGCHGCILHVFATSRHCERSEASSRHCELPVIARGTAPKQSPCTTTATGSASPPCLHNVGYGRPAPFAVRRFVDKCLKLSFKCFICGVPCFF